jgi:alpha-glucoside transport system substrate-binding protein
MNRTRLSLWIRLLAVPVLLMFVAAACGDDDDDGDNGNGTPSGSNTPSQSGNIGTVNALGLWGDEELTSFEAMVEPWKQDTGGDVDFTGTRDITAILTTRVEGGNPPDVALPAEIGLFQQFAREGKLTPLSDCPGLEDTVRANYPQSFIDLGTVNGELYGFFMKADTKATVFYNPKTFTANNMQPLTDSSTFDDLISLSDAAKNAGIAPWSNGQEAGSGTGFPGSDTIQQILLNEAGTDTYDAVVDGSTPYTDPAVKDAWEKFGQLVLTDGYTSQGGAQGVIATAFMDSSYPPFQDPPTAAMVHLGGFAAGFIKDQFPSAVPGDDYDFFPWPGGAVTGGANIAYAFNNNPTTCSFMSYLASAEAQDIWVKRGGFTSVNKQVNLDSYQDEVARKQAQQLLEADTFRFDMDDAIGGAGQQAIFQGVVQYLQNPGSLDSILQSIEGAIPERPAGGETPAAGTPSGGSTPAGTPSGGSTPPGGSTPAGTPSGG